MSTSHAVKTENGISRIWKTGHCIHREDGPAIELSDGTEIWVKKGKIHREDGPAVIFPTGSMVWFIKNKIHRTDGPAIVYSDGNKEWYHKGKCHMSYVPMEQSNRTQETEDNRRLRWESTYDKCKLIAIQTEIQSNPYNPAGIVNIIGHNIQFRQ